MRCKVCCGFAALADVSSSFILAQVVSDVHLYKLMLGARAITSAPRHIVHGKTQMLLPWEFC